MILEELLEAEERQHYYEPIVKYPVFFEKASLAVNDEVMCSPGIWAVREFIDKYFSRIRNSPDYKVFALDSRYISPAFNSCVIKIFWEQGRFTHFTISR